MAGWKMGEAAGWTVFASMPAGGACWMALCAVTLGWLALRLCSRALLLLAGVAAAERAIVIDLRGPGTPLIPGLAALAVAMDVSIAGGGQGFHGRRGVNCGRHIAGLIAMARPPYAAMALMLFARRWSCARDCPVDCRRGQRLL